MSAKRAEPHLLLMALARITDARQKARAIVLTQIVLQHEKCFS